MFAEHCAVRAGGHGAVEGLTGSQSLGVQGLGSCCVLVTHGAQVEDGSQASLEAAGSYVPHGPGQEERGGSLGC